MQSSTAAAAAAAAAAADAAAAPADSSLGSKGAASKQDPRKKTVSETNEDESSDSDIQLEKRRKVTSRKNKSTKKNVKLYNVSSSSNTSDSASVTGTGSTEDDTADDDIQEMSQTDSLDEIMGAQAIIEESAQRMTQHDMEMMDLTLNEDKFNQAILGPRSSTPQQQLTSKQINGYVMTENDRRESVFEHSIYHRIYNTNFDGYKSNVYQVPVQGVTSHSIKIYAESLIPSKVAISEKYQTKKNFQQQKIDIATQDLKSTVSAINHFIENTPSGEKYCNKQVELNGFGTSTLSMQLTVNKTNEKILKLTQDFPQAAKDIEELSYQVNPRSGNMLKKTTTIEIPSKELHAFKNSLNAAVSFHDFLLCSNAIQNKVLTEVARYYKEAVGDDTSYTHSKGEVYNRVLHTYHRFTTTVNQEYPIRIPMKRYLQKHQDEEYAIPFYNKQ